MPKLSEIPAAANPPSVTDTVVGVGAGPVDLRYNIGQIQGSAGTWVNVKSYGAKGDGVTNDFVAFNSAISAVSAAGGGTVFVPSGNYVLSQSLNPVSNVNIQGAGSVTTTINVPPGAPPPFNCGILIIGHNGLQPTVSYPINNPVTMGTNTVTTTTASDAGNFSAGSIILIHGPQVGGGFIPQWWTTVKSVNASTGVITLTETLPTGDTQINAVSLLTSITKNIRVADISVVNSIDIAFQVTFCQNIIVDRVSFTNYTGPNASLEIDSCRDCIVSNCFSSGSNFTFEAGGSWNVVFQNIRSEGGCFVFDAGTSGSAMVDCNANDPFTNGINITSGSQLNRVVSCSVLNAPAGTAGIVIQGDLSSGQNQGSNVLVANTISGVSNSTVDGISIVSSNNNAVICNNFNNVGAGVRATNSLNLAVTLNTFENLGSGPFAFDSACTVQTVLIPMTFGTILSGSTFAVGNSGAFSVFNASPATVTSFTGGVNGQVLYLNFGDSNTTISTSASRLAGNVNYNPPANTMMQFVNNGGRWYEVSRSNT